MKLIIIIMTTCLMQVSAAGFAQKLTFSKKGASLEEIFKEIKSQTGYNVFYSDKKIDDNKRIDVDFKGTDLKDVLEKTVVDLGLVYSIDDKNISIKPKEISILDKVKAVTLNLFQSIDVQGKIVDEKGVPIPGATVRVKGSAKAAVTDKQGMFLLSKVSEEAVLLVSYIGYETREVGVKEVENNGIVTLKQVTNDLNEVIVNKGYYTEKQRLSTGNVSRVTAEEIGKQPVTDPILALQGRVPGLYISGSGIPGANSTVQLRGQNFMVSGLTPITANDPLFIVDGVPFSSESLSGVISSGALGGGARGAGLSPFNNLNPSDIESIDVLKDADATAIYGSRGANGVILITTKKGQSGQTKFDVNFYTGVSKLPKELPMLNTQQYLQMRYEGLKNDGRLPNLARDFDLTFWDQTRYTDWQKVLIGKAAPFTSGQLSLSGGNQNTQFVVSGGYSKQSTVFPGNYADRKLSSHMSLTHSSTDQHFRATFTASFVHDQNLLPQADFTNFIGLAPNAPALYDAKGNLNWELKSGGATWSNPLASTVNSATALTDYLNANMNLSYQIMNGLEIRSSFGYNHSQLNQNSLFLSAALPPPLDNNPDVRNSTFTTNAGQGWIMEPQINYHKKIGKGDLEALIGSTFQQSSTNNFSNFAQGFASDALVKNPAAATSNRLIGLSNSLYRYTSIFGRIGYNWEEKYLLNVTARRDGSSRFGPGRQFGNFGAVGAGWIFSKEAFAANALSFLSFGKLRVSYGTTGSDAIGDYNFLSTYGSDGVVYNGASGLLPTGLTNPYLQWGLVKKLEAGLALGFLKDRILLTASYYRNRTGNQLVTYQLPYVAGFNTVTSNLPAVVQNTGLEFTLNTINIKSKTFKWSTSLNLSLPKNKLVAYPDLESSSFQGRYIVGQSLFIRQLYHYTGVDPQTGLYTFASKNGSGIPAYPDDVYETKPITQSLFGGLENNFSYKGFQLSFLFQGVKQLGYSYINSFDVPGLSFRNVPTYFLDRWQMPGDQTGTEKFTTIAGSAYQAYQRLLYSDGIITDASFIRLKNISLSYQLSPLWLQKTHIKNARIYLQGQNIFTITAYKGLDPETQGIGLPPLRVITAGLQFNL